MQTNLPIVRVRVLKGTVYSEGLLFLAGDVVRLREDLAGHLIGRQCVERVEKT